MSENVGDVLSEARNKALKAVAIGAGVLVYCGALLYSGVHNFSLLTAGVPEDLIIWAILGVVSLEVTAGAMPIALHYWTHAPLQRMAAMAFYFLDLGIVFLNVAIDFAYVQGTGGALPEWLTLYQLYAMPATPVICGLGWSILWLLDPSQRDRAMREELRAATREALRSKIAEAAKSADVTDQVDQAAQALAREIIASELGGAAARRQAQPVKILAPNRNGHKPELVTYNAEAESVPPLAGKPEEATK